MNNWQYSSLEVVVKLSFTDWGIVFLEKLKLVFLNIKKIIKKTLINQSL
ncbi:hypothetical protein N581_05340 [Lactobacillus jensenii MD IIE-70(2)]|nr:hypothetical protein N581_05340 [Lactobacillus jensenii MD IIE-70(2)]